MASLVAGWGCKKPVEPGPDLQIVGETLRLRSGDPVPRTSPWFDGDAIHLVAARGETLGIQVLHRGPGAVTLALPHTRVQGFAVERAIVRRPSSSMYGGDSMGPGDYPDGLTASAAPATNPAYFTIAVPRELAPGRYHGELRVAARELPVELEVVQVTLPPLPLAAWAEYSPAELGGTIEQPSAAELACSAMFRERGVLLAPPMNAVAFHARKDQIAGAPYVPVDLPRDPAGAAAEARAWIGLAPGQHPFGIPIDEPSAQARPAVRAVAEAVHAANHDMIVAVTDQPRAEYGDTVDLYLDLHAKLADTFLRWTYNGSAPGAGSMVVDAAPPGTRTWGWIAWRYRIPIWYAWDALYWHDRHNHKTAPPRTLDVARDATSFDNSEDHGNLDGVLAMPGGTGCRPTLRLEALRRGLEDRALLELAAQCDPDATAALAKRLVPTALGDASGAPSWPRDEASWEAARRRLLELAACSP